MSSTLEAVARGMNVCKAAEEYESTLWDRACLNRGFELRISLELMQPPVGYPRSRMEVMALVLRN